MVPMLQCGLVRSNFALAIHIHPCRLRTSRGVRKPRLVTAENAPVQARTSGPILSSPCRLSALSRHGNKKSNRETSMNAQVATKQVNQPQTPPLPEARPESLGLSPTRLARMSDAFKREIDKGTVPGLTVMVARRGQIGWFEALGRQNPAVSAPMAHNSIFRIFSMTKPIVSVGVMMLLEEGLFLLNDPIAKYIPEFSDQKVGVESNGKLELVPLTRP